jgi:hypothetical protein
MKHLILRYTNEPGCVLQCTGCYLKNKELIFEDSLEVPEADETDLYVYHNDLQATESDQTLQREINKALELCSNPVSISSILSSSRLIRSLSKTDDSQIPALPDSIAISIKHRNSTRHLTKIITEFNLQNITLSHTIGVEPPETLKECISLFYELDQISNVILMVRKPVENITQEAMNILFDFCRMFPFVTLDECIINMISGWDCTKHNGRINKYSDSHVRHVLNGKSYHCMYPSDTCLMGQKSYILEASDLKYLQDLITEEEDSDETGENN